MEGLIKDKHFRVEVLSKTGRPNLLSYLAMHQDYSEEATYDDYVKFSKLSESELGYRLVRNCIKYSHWGILEHPSITLNVIGFPHSVMVQARTHRVGTSFDVQSQRYTGKRVYKLSKAIYDYEDLYRNGDINKKQDYLDDRNNAIEKVFYFRPPGNYTDREGAKYYYNPSDDLDVVSNLVETFCVNIDDGYAYEHARDFLPQNIRQSFVVTFNARSLLHFCDLRLPKDAQPEIRTLAEMLFEIYKVWMPEVATWYEKNRYGRNKLAP